MAPTYQRKEDFSPKIRAWVSAAAKAWNIPEEELWNDLFRIARELDSEQPKEPPSETLQSFPLPKPQ